MRLDDDPVGGPPGAGRDQVVASVKAFLESGSLDGQPNAIVGWKSRGEHGHWNDCFEVVNSNGHYWAEKYLAAYPEHADWISSGAVAVVVKWRPEPKLGPVSRAEAEKLLASIHKLLASIADHQGIKE